MNHRISSRRGDVLPRFVAAIFLVAALYVFFVYLPGRNQVSRDKPLKYLTSVRVALHENQLLLASFTKIDGKSLATPETLEALSQQAKDSHDKIVELEKENNSVLDSEIRKTISETLNLEGQLLDQYQARYNMLSKIITYNPSQDLETADRMELTARTRDTSNALKQFVNKPGLSSVVKSVEYKYNLSEELKDSLSESSNCFAELAASLEQQAFEETKTRCVNTYATTRLLATDQVTSTFKSELAKKTSDGISEAINMIDARIKVMGRT